MNEKRSHFSEEEWASFFRESPHVKKSTYAFESDTVTIKTQFPRIDADESTQSSHTFSVESLDDQLYKLQYDPQNVVKYILSTLGAPTIMKSTLVALFDIQAYSCFVENNEVDDCAAKIRSLFERVKVTTNTKGRGSQILHWVFSDSILVTIDTSCFRLNREYIKIFFATCSAILGDAMRCGLPLRGAVGGGDLFKDGSILVSTGLTDAAKFEKNQDWLGAVVTPQAVKIIDQHFPDFSKSAAFEDANLNQFLRYGKIPWKLNYHMESDYFFVKPWINDPKWKERYLPSYFNIGSKTSHSEELYGK